MIFFKKKLIFVHIPRCGGTSIEQNLWRNEFNNGFSFNDNDEKHLLQGFIDEYRNKYQYDGLQHLIFDNIKKVYPNEISNFFKFSFIRNPFSRIASTYAGVMTFRKDLRNFLVIYKDSSFKKFLKLVKKNPHTHWLPMSKFFRSNSLDFIGKFENFNNDLDRLGKLISINFPKKNYSGKLNFSEKFNYLDFYRDRENIDLVREIYQEDLDRFDYSFDDFIIEEKKKQSTISMQPNLAIPDKEKKMWRFIKKYFKKKIYLIKNNIKF